MNLALNPGRNNGLLVQVRFVDIETETHTNKCLHHSSSDNTSLCRD